MNEWMVTANLAGPSAAPEVRAATEAWGRSALERQPAFVFLQELPSDSWLAPWIEDGYTPSFGVSKGWRVRSAVLARHGLSVSALTPSDNANLAYHGDYVAAARWDSIRGPVLLASVHASPNEAEPDRYGWTRQLPEPRAGGGDPRHPGGRLWDSDLLLATLGGLAAGGATALVAAGDFNEAVAYDLDAAGAPQGSWGREYFDRARALALHPWLSDQWGGERPTRGAWQLDHILVTPAAERFLLRDPEPHLDPEWSGDTAPRSDHAPIWAALDEGYFAP